MDQETQNSSMYHRQLPSLLIFIILGITLLVYVIRPFCLSPLARIPNAHPLAPYTRLWILWQRYTDQHFITVSQCFGRQGPIIRIGPKELAVNTVDNGLKTVHGGAGFPKTAYYSWFARYGYVIDIKSSSTSMLVPRLTENVVNSTRSASLERTTLREEAASATYTLRAT